MPLRPSSLFSRCTGHIARRVTALVDVAVPDPAVLTPPDSPTEPNSACKAPPSPLPSVEEFIWRLVEESGAYTPTLLVSLVYLDRIDKRYRAMRGTASSPLRLALASLICAGKYVNDRCPRSKHWVSLGGVKVLPSQSRLRRS